MLITPKEIRTRAERHYPKYLVAMAEGAPFTPIEIPFRKVRASDPFDAVRCGVETLIGGSRERRGTGYTVTLEPVNTRLYGTQHHPVRIAFESEPDYLGYLGRRGEVTRLRADIDLIRVTLPVLDAWVRRSVRVVVANAGRWGDLLTVCQYFLNHPRPNLYARELPLGVHTKFVEEHQSVLRELLDELLPPEAIDPAATRFEERFLLRYDEPLVRLRFLDAAVQRRLQCPVSDLSVPVGEVGALDLAGAICVITENRMNFLTLPSLPNAVAIWGGGFRAELLRRVHWLADCRLLYWGDIDAQGFQILSQLRSAYPQTESVMMDLPTFETYRAFAVPGTPCAVESLSHLRPAEQAAFAYVAENALRLEQEKIGQAYAARHIGSRHARAGDDRE